VSNTVRAKQRRVRTGAPPDEVNSLVAIQFKSIAHPSGTDRSRGMDVDRWSLGLETSSILPLLVLLAYVMLTTRVVIPLLAPTSEASGIRLDEICIKKSSRNYNTLKHATTSTPGRPSSPIPHPVR
jgi:hypothetical protein